MLNIIKRLLFLILPDHHTNKSLRILIFVNSTLLFITGLFSPFYAMFILHIGGSVAFAGLSWAIYSIVGGILIFLFSKWQLKVKEPELLIALGYLLRGGVFFSYAFMTNMTQLLVTQVLWGVAIALGTPAFDSIYSKHTTKDGSIAEWGEWEGVAAIVTGIAALVGGLLIQWLGYQTIFIVMTIISVGLGIYIWLLPREVL
jgi:MFS family permease